jgi:hypothetical protein
MPSMGETLQDSGIVDLWWATLQEPVRSIDAGLGNGHSALLWHAHAPHAAALVFNHKAHRPRLPLNRFSFGFWTIMCICKGCTPAIGGTSRLSMVLSHTTHRRRYRTRPSPHCLTYPQLLPRHRTRVHPGYRDQGWHRLLSHNVIHPVGQSTDPRRSGCVCTCFAAAAAAAAARAALPVGSAQCNDNPPLSGLSFITLQW